MSELCNKVQELLADCGLNELERDVLHHSHLLACEDCTEFLRSLTIVDLALSQLPEHDATKELVDRVAKAVAADTQTVDRKEVEPGRRRGPAAMGEIAHFVLKAVKWIFPTKDSVEWGVFASLVAACAVAVLAFMTQGVSTAFERVGSATSAAGGGGGIEGYHDPRLAVLNRELAANHDRFTDMQINEPVDKFSKLKMGKDKVGWNLEAGGYRDAPIVPEIREQINRDDGLRKGEMEFDTEPRSVLAEGRIRASAKKFDTPKTNDPSDVNVSLSPPTESSRSTTISAESESSDKNILAEFFRKRASLDGLHYKDAEGYWLNTYIPGDPAIRKLQLDLQSFDSDRLAAITNQNLKLDERANLTGQPFDDPQNSALAVYLHADRAQLQEKSRFLLQVGLKGTPRQAGTRPAMNVGIVFNLDGTILPTDVDNFRALADGFRKQKEIGDQFNLAVAGRPGGVVLRSDDFKHGPLSVALTGLFGSSPLAGETLNLVEATKASLAEVRGADDPENTLGTSEIIIVTSKALGSITEELAKIAHESALSGIPFSVVGIGSGAQLDELDRLTIAGQGNRRLLLAPGEAEELVKRELSAVSRVVARAVRLRIRLLPGVKLVDVIGSRRLDQVSAEQVRQEEQSVDQRMSRNLGIKADRGDDEEGIQIVIPTFYAGDSHVILLDVVADGPGPIADVTARFKDLVYLKNGISRANLSLDRTSGPLSFLERNVLKNYLAYELSNSLNSAAKALVAQDQAYAAKIVQGQHQLLLAMRSNIPEYLSDRDINQDIAMLDDYAIAVGKARSLSDYERLYLTKSLDYAGYLKLVPRPVIDG